MIVSLKIPLSRTLTPLVLFCEICRRYGVYIDLIKTMGGNESALQQIKDDKIKSRDEQLAKFIPRFR